MRWQPGRSSVRWVGSTAPVNERQLATLEPLSTRLIRLRLERRLSQRGMAQRLGRDHAIVSRWESADRTPTLVDMATIARVLRTDLDTLLEGVTVDGPARQRSSRAHGNQQRVAIGRALRLARMVRRLRPPVVMQHTGIQPRRLLAIEAGVDLKVRGHAVRKMSEAGMPADHPFVVAALEYFETVRAHTATMAAGHLRDFLEYCSKRGIDPLAITKANALAYERVLRDHYAPTSVYGKCASIRRAYAFVMANGHIGANPFSQVATGTPEPRTPTPALDQTQLDDLMARLMREALRPGATLTVQRDAVLVYTLMRIGPRRVEAHRMTWESFGHDRGVPVLRIHGKGDSHATMTLPDDVAQVLDWWKERLAEAMGRPCRYADAMFPSLGKGNSELKAAVKANRPLDPIVVNTITATFKRIFAEAGLDGPRMATHVARATAATIGYEVTKDIVAVQNMLRHKNVTTTYMYIRRKGDARSVAGQWSIAAPLPSAGASMVQP